MISKSYSASFSISSFVLKNYNIHGINNRKSHTVFVTFNALSRSFKVQIENKKNVQYEMHTDNVESCVKSLVKFLLLFMLKSVFKYIE